MPDKTPDVWTQIWAWLTLHFAHHNQTICGVVIAFLVSITKSFLYGKADTVRRVIAEAVLCSLIAWASQPVWIWLNLPANLITPFGAGLGLLGTSAVRQFILKFINRKAGMNNEQL